MKNNKLLSVLCFASMAVACFNPLGKEASAGNYFASCSNIEVVSGRFLQAQCKDRNGRLRNSNLDLNTGIGNTNGRLVRGSQYIRSCRLLPSSGTLLSADCKTRRGNVRGSSIRLNNIISNINGRLKFDR